MGVSNIEVVPPNGISSGDEVADIFKRNWSFYFSIINRKYPYMEEDDINDYIASCRARILVSHHLYNPVVGITVNSWIIISIFNIIKDDNRKKSAAKNRIDEFGSNDYFRFMSNLKTSDEESFIFKDYVNAMLVSRKLNIIEKHLMIRLMCGYTYNELASKMNIPLNSVKVKIFRLRKKCNKVFKSKQKK